MTITLLRVDDRLIHGQTIVRWAQEYPCDGIIAVNDEISKNPVLKNVYICSSDKKTFIWSMEEWSANKEKVLSSASNYFLLTRDAIDMLKVLQVKGFDPGVKEIFFGQSIMKPGSKPIGDLHFHLSPQEASACEQLSSMGFKIFFALVKDNTVGDWSKVKKIFGY